jgi:Protein of unknown function (DUF2877)
MSSADTRLRCYERGDLDEFFGLFGNSLANTLAAIFLISMVAKVPNEIVFGSIVLGAITAFIIDKNYRISTALARPAREPDAHGALLVLQELVSLGPGLTPAGDDFMIGWLAGLTLTARSPSERTFLAAVCTDIGARHHRVCSRRRPYRGLPCANAAGADSVAKANAKGPDAARRISDKALLV